jgi:putative ribosome biogenesis GTPase RsgA
MKLALIYGKESANAAPELIDAADTYSIIGTDVKTGQNIFLATEARLQCVWLIGATGTGKSSLIARLIAQDIENNLGVCLVEPHGDLT